MKTILLCLALLQDDPEKILREMDARLEKDPTDIEALQKRADAFLVLGKNAQAVEACDRALRVDPANALSYRLRGRGRLAVGDIKGALADLNRSIEVDPKEAMAWIQRARAGRMLGDEERAKADIERALALNPEVKEAAEKAMKGKDPELWVPAPKSVKQRIDEGLKAKDAAKLAETGEEGIAELKKLAETKEHGELAKQALEKIQQTVKRAEELAKELDAQDLVERDKAFAEIVKLGRGAVPTFKRLAAGASKSAKAHLEAAIKRFEE